MLDDLSLVKRYNVIKLIYNKAQKYNTSYLSIHNDECSSMDLKYLEDKGFIDIKVETGGEISTAIQVRAPLIEYVEKFEDYCEP